MTRQPYIILILISTLFGCNQKTEDNKVQSKVVIEKKNIKEEIPNKRSKIIITHYDNFIPDSKSTLNYGPFSTDIIYETSDSTILNQFDKMLNDSFKTGYCCCPRENFTISFYDKTNNYENYYVDTLEYRDTVIIYQVSYQFSFLVNKSKWSAFLKQMNTISFNEYFITNLKKARIVYDYTLKNDLPIITSNRVSKEWMLYDGDFKFKVSFVGEDVDLEKIYDNIKKAYPKDKYKIEQISRYRHCGSSKKNDCYEEYVFQVFCSKDFYDRFEIYEPKSAYEDALAEFYVIGSREKLDKIDAIAEKEKE